MPEEEQYTGLPLHYLFGAIPLVPSDSSRQRMTGQADVVGSR
jgi:hypothetical protein